VKRNQKVAFDFEQMKSKKKDKGDDTPSNIIIYRGIAPVKFPKIKNRSYLFNK
jgi:hypothetical protein